MWRLGRAVADRGRRAQNRSSSGGDAGVGQGPEPRRPGTLTIDGAQTGGTIKVISAARPNTMDPTEAYYTDTTSILSGLVTRSLTQYV